jgi:hypothetical protein
VPAGGSQLGQCLAHVTRTARQHQARPVRSGVEHEARSADGGERNGEQGQGHGVGHGEPRCQRQREDGDLDTGSRDGP